MTTDAPRYGQVDRDYAIELATTPPDEDGPVWMVNLMKYREVADYRDGSAENGQTISGREADDIYTPIGPLTAIGAEIVFGADVEDQLLGDSPRWDRIGIVKYPTRRSFIEMQQREDFQRQHVHKEAGMEETIVIGCQPMANPTGGKPLRDWSGVPNPPTDEDGEVVVMHVLRFEDAAGAAHTPAEMEQYQLGARTVAQEQGVRIDGWFSVEGTILGDGRAWHQVRFNTFPSKRAFMEVVRDPDRLTAQREHREGAIADTYTMILRPVVNNLAASVD